MGLPEKVALAFISGVITQIAITYCFPIISRKALTYYPNNYKHGHSITTLESPYLSRRITSSEPIFVSNKAKITTDNLSKKSIYNIKNVPKVENSAKAPIRFGTQSKSNNFESDQKPTHSQLKALNDLKKEMRMKQKLKNINDSDNYVTQYSNGQESIWLEDTKSFPDVQYPLTVMETWSPHYLNAEDEQELDHVEVLKFKSKKDKHSKSTFKAYKPQLKSKTQQYIEQVEKLTKKMRKSSIIKVLNTTETSKESIVNKAQHLTRNDSNVCDISQAAEVDFPGQVTEVIQTELNKDNSPVLNEIISKSEEVKDILEEEKLAILNEIENDNSANLIELENNHKCDNSLVSMVTQSEPDSDAIEDGPLSIKLPIPLTSDLGVSNQPISEIDQLLLNGIPCTSVTVIPAGYYTDPGHFSVTERSQGSPMIVVLQAPQINDISSQSNANDPNTLQQIVETITNNSLPISILSENLKCNSFIAERSTDTEPQLIECILEMPAGDFAHTSPLSPEFEMLPNNSMCYTSISNTSSQIDTTKESHLHNSNKITSNDLFNDLVNTRDSMSGYSPSSVDDFCLNDTIPDITKPIDESYLRNTNHNFDFTENTEISTIDGVNIRDGTESDNINYEPPVSIAMIQNTALVANKMKDTAVTEVREDKEDNLHPISEKKISLKSTVPRITSKASKNKKQIAPGNKELKDTFLTDIESVKSHLLTEKKEKYEQIDKRSNHFIRLSEHKKYLDKLNKAVYDQTPPTVSTNTKKNHSKKLYNDAQNLNAKKDIITKTTELPNIPQTELKDRDISKPSNPGNHIAKITTPTMNKNNNSFLLDGSTQNSNNNSVSEARPDVTTIANDTTQPEALLKNNTKGSESKNPSDSSAYGSTGLPKPTDLVKNQTNISPSLKNDVEQKVVDSNIEDTATSTEQHLSSAELSDIIKYLYAFV